MSRSGYSDDYEEEYPNAVWLFQQSVTNAIKGARGQAMLRDLLAALDAMPVKELIAHELVDNGRVCALGALAQKRGLDVANVDPEDSRRVGKLFCIARTMAQEIVFQNDDDFRDHMRRDERGNLRDETPTERWSRVRAWVVVQIKQGEQAGGEKG